MNIKTRVVCNMAYIMMSYKVKVINITSVCLWVLDVSYALYKVLMVIKREYVGL